MVFTSLCVLFRIPKSGSRTTVEYFDRLTKDESNTEICLVKQRSSIRDFQDPNALDLYGQHPTQFVCEKKQKKNRKYVVIGHNYYVPPYENHKDDLDNFNILREPVSRCQSRFYYEIERERIPEMKFADCMKNGFCQLPDPSLIKGSASMGYGQLIDAQKTLLKEQMTNQGISAPEQRRWQVIAEECSSNHQTRWMCGMQDICYKGTPQQVIEEAKRVAAEQYEVIGTTDRIPESMWVLNTVYENMLGKRRDWDYYTQEPCAHCPKTFSAPRPPLLKKDEEVLKSLNSLDGQLIEFVHDLLTMKHVACARSIGQVS